MNDRVFTTNHATLDEIITHVYGISYQQIIGGPNWVDKNQFAIAGKPDMEGEPSDEQWKMMLRKFLADRFKLTFHHGKKELLVYVLSIGKNGPKLTKSQNGAPRGPLGISQAPGGVILPARNATMEEFVQIMQTAVLNGPVVNHTGIQGRYDFALTWTPDASQFNGFGDKWPHPAHGTAAAPDLFTAIQQQLGLKLEYSKELVDVLIIDRAEEPSED